MKMKNLQTALSICERGFPIIPLWDPVEEAPSKAPRWARRGELVRKTEKVPSVHQVRQWWTAFPQANIGLLTGPLSGLVVLDLDPRQAEEAGRDTETLRGILNYTPFQVQTGQKGGTHYYFRYDPSLKWEGRDRSLKPTRGPLAIGAGLDIPWYVVVPPSIHPDTGNVYKWKGASLFEEGILELPALPVEFYEFAQREAKTPGERTYWISSMLNETQHTSGNRNNSLAALGGYLINKLPPDVVIAILNNWNISKLKVPLGERTIQNSVISLLRTDERHTWKAFNWNVKGSELATAKLFSKVPIVQKYIKVLSRSKNLDPSMVVLSVFSAVSSVMLQRYHIEARSDWQLCPTFGALCGAVSGNSKSVVHDEIIKALTPSFVHVAAERGTRKEMVWRTHCCANLQETIKVIQRRGVSSGKLSSSIVSFQEAYDVLKKYTAPIVPRLKTFTPEAFENLLVQQGFCNVYLDEGISLFETIAGKYSDNSSLSTFINALEGASILNSTVSRGHAEISSGQGTFHIMMQSELLGKMAGGSYGKNQTLVEAQGFFPRLMFAMPQDMPTQEDTDIYAKQQSEVTEMLGQLLLKVCKTGGKSLRPLEGHPKIDAVARPCVLKEPVKIKFSEAARKIVYAVRAAVKVRKKPGEDLFKYGRWANRIHEKVVRIATFLHVLEHPEGPHVVQADTVEKAKNFILDWGVPHMVAAYQAMDTPVEAQDGKELWDLLTPFRTENKDFKYLDAARQTRWNDRKKRIFAALDFLIEMGLVRVVRENLKPTNPEQSFRCNPYANF